MWLIYIEVQRSSFGECGLGGTYHTDNYVRPPDPVEIRAAFLHFLPLSTLSFSLSHVCIKESFLGFWYMPTAYYPCADIPATHRESPN